MGQAWKGHTSKLTICGGVQDHTDAGALLRCCIPYPQSPWLAGSPCTHRLSHPPESACTGHSCAYGCAGSLRHSLTKALTCQKPHCWALEGASTRGKIQLGAVAWLHADVSATTSWRGQWAVDRPEIAFVMRMAWWDKECLECISAKQLCRGIAAQSNTCLCSSCSIARVRDELGMER